MQGRSECATQSLNGTCYWLSSWAWQFSVQEAFFDWSGTDFFGCPEQCQVEGGPNATVAHIDLVGPAPNAIADFLRGTVLRTFSFSAWVGAFRQRDGSFSWLGGGNGVCKDRRCVEVDPQLRDYDACAYIGGMGDTMGFYSGHGLVETYACRMRMPCLCALSDAPQPPTAQQQAAFEDLLARNRRFIGLRVLYMGITLTIFAPLPALILVGIKLWRRLIDGRAGMASSSALGLEGHPDASPADRGIRSMLRSKALNSLRGVHRLAEQHRAHLRLHTLHFGWVLMAIGDIPLAAWSLGVGWPSITLPIHAFLCFSALGSVLTLLSVPPTDGRLIRLSAYGYTTYSVLFATMCFVSFGRWRGIEETLDLPPVFAATYFALGCVVIAGSLLVLSASLPTSAPRVSLRRMWRAIRLMFLLEGILLMAVLIYLTATEYMWQWRQRITAWISALVHLLLAGLTTPENRGRFLLLFGRRAQHAQLAASAVAGLLSGRSAEATIALAERLFRVLPIDELHESDLAASGATGSQSADPSLAVQPASMTERLRSAGRLVMAASAITHGARHAPSHQSGEEPPTHSGGRPQTNDGVRLLDDHSFNKRRSRHHTQEGGGDGSASTPALVALAPASAPLRLLSERTVPAALGDCAAFISHSWKDPGARKHATLRRWADAYEEAHVHRPVVWLDKGSCTPAFEQFALALRQQRMLAPSSEPIAPMSAQLASTRTISTIRCAACPFSSPAVNACSSCLASRIALGSGASWSSSCTCKWAAGPSESRCCRS